MVLVANSTTQRQACTAGAPEGRCQELPCAAHGAPPEPSFLNIKAVVSGVIGSSGASLASRRTPYRWTR